MVNQRKIKVALTIGLLFISGCAKSKADFNEKDCLNKGVKVLAFANDNFISHGSAVFVDPKGIILTQNHIINGSDKVKVLLPYSQEFVEAKVLARDSVKDLAILKAPVSVPFAVVLWSKFKRGDIVYAIGNPIDQDFKVVKTTIAALGYVNVMGKAREIIFVADQGSIGPGFSGGGLFNQDGQLIGTIEVCFANAGLCGAIPSKVLSDYISNKK